MEESSFPGVFAGFLTASEMSFCFLWPTFYTPGVPLSAGEASAQSLDTHMFTHTYGSD